MYSFFFTSLLPSWRTIGWLTGIGSVCCGGLLFALYWFQDKLLYLPAIPEGSRHSFFNPTAFSMPQQEEVIMRAADGTKLQGWLFHRSKQAGTMLYFCGNAGNISHRLDHLALFWSRLDCNIFIASYRGYGKSEGMPTEAGLKLDAQAALDFLCSHSEIDRSRIFVFGESLGGAVSIQLAADNPDRVQALLLLNTFTSIEDMVAILFPALRRMSSLVTNKWNSLATIKNVRCPILFLSGQRDELVPPRMMQALHDAATASAGAKLVLFKNGQHNTTWLAQTYVDELASFLLGHHLVSGSKL